MQPRGRHKRETRAKIQQGPCTESRSLREEQYEARPQMKNKQKAQDKEPENEDKGINFIQAQLESLGIDSSFTGFLKDPTAQYVKNLEGQLTTALAKRQISPPMGETNAHRAKKSCKVSPRREIIPLPQMRPRSQPPQQYQQPIAGPSMTRITLSQSDNTLRREPPLPYNKVAVPRGLGPKVPNNGVSRKPSTPTPIRHVIWNALNKEAYIEADDEQLRRLAEHGLPPPIRAWDGWDKVKNKNIKCLESNEWLFIGEEVHPIYLRSRSAESAEYLYDTEWQRINALRHAEQAVGENPHDPEGVLDATNVAPGTTNVVPGTTEDEKMIEDTDENPPSAEPLELNRSEAMSSSAGDEPAVTSSSEGS
ncbi:hypothetical protein BD779DRAFT_1478392 [Infundibulicybe gibba]|nr:hypothetical protein BD779DRAFT_1478392 [Infundibulicybe gibba]